MANMSMGHRNAMERAAAGDESILRGRDGSRAIAAFVHRKPTNDL